MIVAFIHQESYLFAILFSLILVFDILFPNLFKKKLNEKLILVHKYEMG